jgi:hypothetical protein
VPSALYSISTETFLLYLDKRPPMLSDTLLSLPQSSLFLPASQQRKHGHQTFGKSGHTKSQRSCMLRASRLGQSPFSCCHPHFFLPHSSSSSRLTAGASFTSGGKDGVSSDTVLISELSDRYLWY